MLRRPPSSTRTDALPPSTPLCRPGAHRVPHGHLDDLATLARLGSRAHPAESGGLERGVGAFVDRAERMRQALLVQAEHHHPQAQIGRAHVELQSLMRNSYAVFCLKKKNHTTI